MLYISLYGTLIVHAENAPGSWRMYLFPFRLWLVTVARGMLQDNLLVQEKMAEEFVVD